MASLLLDWPDALEAAGVHVRVLDGWDTPHLYSNGPYDWREPDAQPAGMMHHHTAGSSYLPNRDKASAYAGLSIDGSARLYQENYGDGNAEPVFVIANAYPAPISSGYGVRAVLEEFVKLNIPFVGSQRSPDDDWAGNTHYINIEWVLDGVGQWIDPDVWDMMVVVCRVTNDLMTRPAHLWTPARHVGHAHHTRRKIDLRDGRWPDADLTIQALRQAMGDLDMTCPWTNTTDSAKPWFDEHGPCDSHYDVGRPLQWGINTGVCNVPWWGEDAVGWAASERIIMLTDGARDDFDHHMTDGRYWVFQHRAAGSPPPSSTEPPTSEPPSSTDP